MSEKEIKRILLTTGYTTQTDKDAIYHYIKELKEIIEEVREYIEENPLYYYVYDEEELYPTISEEKARKEILQILDKAKEL